MVIKKLHMHNFGVYAGDNEFVFNSHKPVVLIGGMNGRGKTTFLEAVLLALYGSNSFAYTESGRKSYSQYLRSFINRNADDNICKVELEFEINNTIKENYVVRREWDALNKRTREHIYVYKDGMFNEFLTANWPMFVENILPRACLKKAFCKMCVTICGRFRPDEGAVAGYGNRIRVKYTAKWGVQIAGMIFQTHSSTVNIK